MKNVALQYIPIRIGNQYTLTEPIIIHFTRHCGWTNEIKRFNQTKTEDNCPSRLEAIHFGESLTESNRTATMETVVELKLHGFWNKIGSLLDKPELILFYPAILARKITVFCGRTGATRFNKVARLIVKLFYRIRVSHWKREVSCWRGAKAISRRTYV